ncbi:MAG: dipeptidyl-peptidase-4 [Planctomycetota bacterium]
MESKIITLEATAGRGERLRLGGSLESWAWAGNGIHLVRGRGESAVTLDANTLEPVVVEAVAEEPEGTSPPSKQAKIKAALEALGDLGTGGEPELAELSPDETQLAFVRDRDLYVLSIADNTLTPITNDGSIDQYDGILDWVYQEEVYGRGNFKGFWWNASSTHIGFLSLDESAVHPFTVIDHVVEGNFRVEQEVTHYPKSGDPNPTTRVGVYDVGAQDLQWIDLAEYGQSEPLVVRISWTPDGSTMLYTVQDRTQTWAELVARDVSTGERTVWIREESESWVNRPAAPRWLTDGSFLWESERTGYKHLYHYAQGGELLATLTSGEWEVRKVLRLDEDQGSLWFTASRDGAVSENTYSVGLDGKGLLRLTDGPGTHRVTANGDGSLFIDRVSSLTRAPELRLCDGRTGAVLKVLATSDPAPAGSPALARWELHEIPARDGFPLDVAVLKPLNFDPAKTYPIWLSTYSGPDAPTIRNTWRPSSWNQFLAQEGVIILNVNVRTASGKGHAVISQCYENFLTQELMDIVDTVDWLTANSWADAARVGITGWSYGGSMTAFALTHSDRFALGIAGAGVYDWRMYDSIYTERYMNTPQANPAGYERSSSLAAAGNLQGHLVLQHGTKDDNVHFQNTVQMIYALQKAGMADFELMLYPESRHGVRDADLRWQMRQREWASIQRYLMGDQDNGQ